METMLIGLTATGTAIVLTPFAVVVAGIRRQERASSLRAQPPGPAAALARKLLALHTEPLTGSALNHAAQRQPLVAQAHRRHPARPAPAASEARS